MSGADYRIAANSNTGRLPDSQQRQLIHRFIRKGARARYHADLARLVDVAGHDPDLALARRDDTGAVGADKPRLLPAQVALDLDHIEDGDAFSDAYYQLDPGIRGFHDRIARERWRNIDHADVASGCLARLLDGVENRDPFEARSAFARHHAGDHLGAVLFARPGMELPGGAGDSLSHDPGVLVDQNTHRLSPAARLLRPPAARRRPCRRRRLPPARSPSESFCPARRWCLPCAPPAVP